MMAPGRLLAPITGLSSGRSRTIWQPCLRRTRMRMTTWIGYTRGCSRHCRSTTFRIRDDPKEEIRPAAQHDLAMDISKCVANTVVVCRQYAYTMVPFVTVLGVQRSRWWWCHRPRCLFSSHDTEMEQGVNFLAALLKMAERSSTRCLSTTSGVALWTGGGSFVCSTPVVCIGHVVISCCALCPGNSRYWCNF